MSYVYMVWAALGFLGVLSVATSPYHRKSSRVRLSLISLTTVLLLAYAAYKL